VDVDGFGVDDNVDGVDGRLDDVDDDDDDDEGLGTVLI